MDKLTPTLNDSQIKENIDALQKQGVSNDKVQDYVDNYTKGSDDSYVLKTSQSIQMPENKSFNDIPVILAKGLQEDVLQPMGNVGKALLSSEIGVGSTIGQGQALRSQDFANAQTSKQGLDNMIFKTEQQIREDKKQGKDTSHLESLLANVQGRTKGIADVETIAPDTRKTNTQALGEVAGVGLDMLSAGAASKGAQSFKVAKDVVQASNAAKELSTLQKVGKIAAETGKAIAVGGATGYGYDVAASAQKDNLDFTPGLGTAIGVALPGAIGATKVAGTLLEGQAPRIINSLIGTRKTDFAYGKNPGRAIAESKIVANTLPELEDKVTLARQTEGQTIGNITSKLEGKAKVELGDALKPINDAIKEASKSPRTNSSLIERLNNVKQDLLGSLDLPEGGVMNTRSLEEKSFNNAFELKKQIGNVTKFTGNPSDDKLVNNALKQTYGKVKGAMNDAALKADPELGRQLVKANERYADFTTAEIALKNRVALNQGKNLVSAPIKVGTVTGILTALGTGGVGIPAILAGVGVGLADKALASTAVKTRIASWLAKESPQVISELAQRNPGVMSTIAKAFTKEYPELDNIVKTAVKSNKGSVSVFNPLYKDTAGIRLTDEIKNSISKELSNYDNKPLSVKKGNGVYALPDDVKDTRIAELQNKIETKSLNDQEYKEAYDLLKSKGIDAKPITPKPTAFKQNSTTGKMEGYNQKVNKSNLGVNK